MHELSPLPSAPPARRDSITPVDRDLRSLADQMRRCARPGNQRFRLMHGLQRSLHFLRQHLVTIAVLLVLLAAALSTR